MNATEITVTARQVQREKKALWTGEIREDFQVEVRLELSPERWGGFRQTREQNIPESELVQPSR